MNLHRFPPGAARALKPHVRKRQVALAFVAKVHRLDNMRGVAVRAAPEKEAVNACELLDGFETEGFACISHQEVMTQMSGSRQEQK
jgi:hypothetical protein